MLQQALRRLRIALGRSTRNATLLIQPYSRPRHRTRKSGFLLWGWRVESRIHLIFLDALRRIAAFSDVLLFGAVTHHSQTDDWPGLFGVFLGVLRLRSVGHREILSVDGFGLA